MKLGMSLSMLITADEFQSVRQGQVPAFINRYSSTMTLVKQNKRFLFDLILNAPSTIFQLNRDGSSWVEPVLSYDKCVLLKDHNAVTPVRLEPSASRSRVKHSTTEPLRSLQNMRELIPPSLKSWPFQLIKHTPNTA